jgi:transcriptional regulator with XRE-family HTH domain
MEHLEIKDRILKILNTENISSAKFADIIGVQRSNISHILSGRNNPGLDFLQKVLIKFPSISPEWLIIGKGEMFKQSLQKEFNFEIQNSYQNIDKTEKESEPVKNFDSTAPAIIQKSKSIRQIFVMYTDNTYEILNPERLDKSP